MAQTQVTIADPDFLSRLDSDIQEIKRGLQNIKAIPPDEFLTVDEFLKKIKSSRWVFDALVRDGKLQYKRNGRKYFISTKEVARWYSGELTLEK